MLRNGRIYATLVPMTPRQKIIIAILAITDIVVTLALVVSVTHTAGIRFSSPLQSPPPAVPQHTCQWQATQLLAYSGLGGTVTLPPDGSLRFEIAYPLSADQTINDAAQSVWTVFDIALKLQEQDAQCATFSRIDITILAHDGPSETQISASASTADLEAFSAGELSEEAFIEHVTYTTRAVQAP